MIASALYLEEAFVSPENVHCFNNILHAIDEIQKNLKDGRDDAV